MEVFDYEKSNVIVRASLTCTYDWACACGATIKRGEAHYCSFNSPPSTPVKPMLTLIEGGLVDGQNSEPVE